MAADLGNAHEEGTVWGVLWGLFADDSVVLSEGRRAELGLVYYLCQSAALV